MHLRHGQPHLMFPQTRRLGGVSAVITHSCNRDTSKQWLEDSAIELYLLMATHYNEASTTTRHYNTKTATNSTLCSMHPPASTPQSNVYTE